MDHLLSRESDTLPRQRYQGRTLLCYILFTSRYACYQICFLFFENPAPWRDFFVAKTRFHPKIIKLFAKLRTCLFTENTVHKLSQNSSDRITFLRLCSTLSRATVFRTLTFSPVHEVQARPRPLGSSRARSTAKIEPKMVNRATPATTARQHSPVA